MKSRSLKEQFDIVKRHLYRADRAFSALVEVYPAIFHDPEYAKLDQEILNLRAKIAKYQIKKESK